MREADSEAVRRAAMYVDTSEALHEAGDLSQPIASALISANHIRGTFAELARAAIRGAEQPAADNTFQSSRLWLSRPCCSQISVSLALRQLI